MEVSFAGRIIYFYGPSIPWLCNNKPEGTIFFTKWPPDQIDLLVLPWHRLRHRSHSHRPHRPSRFRGHGMLETHQRLQALRMPWCGNMLNILCALWSSPFSWFKVKLWTLWIEAAKIDINNVKSMCAQSKLHGAHFFFSNRASKIIKILWYPQSVFCSRLKCILFVYSISVGLFN